MKKVILLLAAMLIVCQFPGFLSAWEIYPKKNYVELDSQGRLPAVDGSQLQNLPLPPPLQFVSPLADGGPDGIYIQTATRGWSGAVSAAARNALAELWETKRGWTKRSDAGVKGWQTIASSSDGSKLIIGPYLDYPSTSADGGSSWTVRTSAGSRNWVGIASSSDGTKLVGVIDPGYIYTSDDSGATWTERTSAGSRRWYSVASSSDGTKLIAAGFSTYIYTSSDSGATWTERTSAGTAQQWAVASSADGTKLVAIAFNGYIYTSSDSGATWNQTGAPQGYWQSVASSADGTKLVAGQSPGYIFTSSDSGSSWTQRTHAGKNNWQSVASSSSGGTIVVAAAYGDSIYRSTDSGVTWHEMLGAEAGAWFDVACSSDCSKIAAAMDNAYIWTYDSAKGDNGYQYVDTGMSQPVCSVTYRGLTWYTAGGTGVKDKFEICAKDATDVYAWRTIY